MGAMAASACALALVAATFSGAGAGVAAAAVTAQEGGERIVAYEVDVTVADSGALLVHEVVEYDFGGAERHGIFRDLVLRLDYDGDHDRVYRLSGVEVEARTPGTPDEHAVESALRGQRIRIGDPDRTITGRHVYDITYRIDGALNGFDRHDELYWNAIGPGWSVPIERAVVRVQAPGAIGEVACFAGPVGSTLPCARAAATGATAGFGPDRLEPGAVFTVVVGLPKGLVPEPAPILEERWSLDRAFSRSPLTVGGALAVLAVGAVLVARLVWQRGRDRRWVGSFVDATFGNPDDRDEPIPLGGDHGVPMQLEPPDGLRPGQVGTLVDERANPVDVTATIVDLAVRGWLRIEEIPKEGWFGTPDWRLVRLRETTAPAPRRDGALLPYERELLDGLFEGRADGEVQLSDLRTAFAARMRSVQVALYDDAVERGWFPTRPDHVRLRWALTGAGVAVVGGAATVIAAGATRAALVPLAVVPVGGALAVAARWMPHRTAAGTGVMRRTLGFRRFITESERDRARFAERAHLFTEYLPYAVVFGATEKWARAFEGLALPSPDTGWYVGSRPFGYISFAESMDGFSVSTAGTLTSTPSGSGSSGFGGGGSAGGGGGGGGGGSW
jgi:hypothetical protein